MASCIACERVGFFKKSILRVAALFSDTTCILLSKHEDFYGKRHDPLCTMCDILGGSKKKFALRDQQA